MTTHLLMTAKDLKKWMEINDKNVIDIASLAKTHPQTVKRFLDGRDVHRVTLEAFKRLVIDNENAKFGGLKASG